MLDAKSYAGGLRYLSARDQDLARLFAEFGTPPEWFREPGFPTLVHIILEQQVSLASARVAFTRLLSLASPLTPERFLTLDDAELKGAGFSRQKTLYGRHLAGAVAGGELNLEAFGGMDDAEVKTKLTRVKGIGSWTADIYLLMSLRRPDAWPAGDLALAVAMREVKRLASRPTPLELTNIAEAWRPWRAVGARLLWNYYLKRRATIASRDEV
ncbi:MAG: DNA-3-methyladenine glycosylase 2 family protein [Acidobacteria bacterium]|nr:DNA-3-methyladenine glycosylase 2 family protein [Acidobacteriota bacterium]